MTACIQKLLERLGIIDHVEDTAWNTHGNIATGDITLVDQTSNYLKIQDASFLISGANGGIPEIGAGTRFMFIPSLEGAIRAGKINSTEWDTIGTASIGLGRGCVASGIKAIAIGRSASATGTDSVAIGKDCSASNQQAVSIGHNNTATEIDALSVGNLNNSTGTGTSICIGRGNNATALGSVAIGRINTSGGASSLAVGFSNTATNYNCVSIGSETDSTGSSSITIGSGGTSRLTNANDNTIWMGVNSAIPTFIIVGNADSTGFIGIVEQAPLSTLDVGGSVGFKYTNVAGSNGATKTILDDEDEYTFRVDLSALTGAADNYNIVLPALGLTTIDRRIYYFKVTNKTGAAAATATLTLKPNASDQLEDWNNTVGPGGELLAAGVGFTISLGDAITVIANNTDGAWWVI